MNKLGIKKIIDFPIEKLFVNQWWWRVLVLDIILSFNITIIVVFLLLIQVFVFIDEIYTVGKVCLTNPTSSEDIIKILTMDKFSDSNEYSFIALIIIIAIIILHVLYKICILIWLYKKSTTETSLWKFFNKFESNIRFALLNIIIITLMDISAFLLTWYFWDDGLLVPVILYGGCCGGGLLSYLALTVFIYGKKLINKNKNSI